MQLTSLETQKLKKLVKDGGAPTKDARKTVKNALSKYKKEIRQKTLPFYKKQKKHYQNLMEMSKLSLRSKQNVLTNLEMSHSSGIDMRKS